MTPRFLIVNVTQEHLDHGVRMECYNCPVALALKDATGHVWHVCRDDARCEEDIPGRKIVKFSPAVRLAINGIDHRIPVEPFTFRIPFRFKKA